MTTTAARPIDTRPSVRTFMHGPTAFVDCETVYECGYRMAELDIASGHQALTAHEMAALWHDDYAEGYADAYADFGEVVGRAVARG